MRRRTLIVAGALASLAPKAWGQSPTVPVIGFLSNRTPRQGSHLVAAVRDGLKRSGFIEGENVTIEYRWSGGELARLPELAADLVRRKVAVIVAGGTPQPARAATASIPIVFTTGLDPVAYGLVKSLNRPDGNLTGATFYSGALGGKQLELLREIAPRTRSVGLLVKPDSLSAGLQTDDVRKSAQAIGQQIEVVKAAVESEFEPAIAKFAHQPNAAMVVSVDPYFDSRADRLVALAARYALPTIYNLREYVDAGGLISYGGSISETYRQAGVYAGRILKGAKPGDLPVVLPTLFELVVNRRVATTLGLTLSPALLARADEVIE
ncbi:MAG: ABC transporter substrate-binding protein [Reyranellales bacterium]